MIKHDYLQEIGLHAEEKKVRWPYAIVILAIIVAAAGAIIAWQIKAHHLLKANPAAMQPTIPLGNDSAGRA